MGIILYINCSKAHIDLLRTNLHRTYALSILSVLEGFYCLNNAATSASTNICSLSVFPSLPAVIPH